MIFSPDLKQRIFGLDQPAFIIAEAGSNHNCSLDMAKSLIDVAAEAGCDVVKFQLFKADSLVPIKSDAHGVLQPLEFPREWLPELVCHCNAAGIPFCAAPFDREAVDLLVELGAAPLLKIASPEILDIPLVRYAARTGCPMLLSTGMANKESIRIALDVIRSEGDSPVVVLHCVSLYPASVEQMNLRMMNDIAQTFDVFVGLSDHSQSILLPAIAVAMGARVIEKHFTLDQHLPGPDHAFALEPNQLRQMVANIREAEVAQGSSEKGPILGFENTELHNKAVLSAVDIKAGKIISEDMLCVKRAPGGIRPVDLEQVIGRTASVNIVFDTVINWDML